MSERHDEPEFAGDGRDLERDDRGTGAPLCTRQARVGSSARAPARLRVQRARKERTLGLASAKRVNAVAC